VLRITRDQLRALDVAAPKASRLDAVLNHLGREHPEVLDGLRVHEARALTAAHLERAEAYGLVGTPALAAYAALAFAFEPDWPKRIRLSDFLPKPADDTFLQLLSNPPADFVRRLEEAYP
jgi:hypothetical protein